MIQEKLINKSLEELRIERLQLFDVTIEKIHLLKKQVYDELLAYRRKVDIIDAQINIINKENRKNLREKK